MLHNVRFERLERLLAAGPTGLMQGQLQVATWRSEVIIRCTIELLHNNLQRVVLSPATYPAVQLMAVHVALR